MHRIAAGLVAVSLAADSSAWAQRGTGDPTGIARRPPLDVIAIAGTVNDAEIGRCASTTGRAAVGAHLRVQVGDGRVLDVHLGPLGAVERLLEEVPDGTAVTADVFRTDAMPADAYVAVTVTAGGEAHQLRDPLTLRPSWAVGPGGGHGGGTRRTWQTPAPRDCWWVEPEG